MKFDASPIWYNKTLHPLSILLFPLSLIFGAGVFLRRLFYRLGIFKTHRFNIPVIVVGNITVGGTGKTPFVIWLSEFLQSQGFKPGIVSRGIGGKKHSLPHSVTEEDIADNVGDEAILLLQNTKCPVVICIDRSAAVNELLRNSDCDIVISDDGLQHYGLSRSIEVVMVDGERKFGNQQLLPAGPLRERVSRIKKADFVVMHGENENHEYTMQLAPLELVSVINPSHKISFNEFARNKIHVVAGIGHPQRFFAMLKNAGFELITHVFPDHHLYQPREMNFSDTLPIIMTEKDAVKCTGFADERYWYVKVGAVLNDSFKQKLQEKLYETKKHIAKSLDHDNCCMRERSARSNTQ